MIRHLIPLGVLLMAGCAAPRDVAPPPRSDLEARFDALIRPDNLSAWMNRLAARPHHLGSAYDKDNAEWIAARFKEWGYATSIEEFRVLFPTPKTRLLEMDGFKASLEEPALKEDATSSQKDEQLPVYNAYSIDGDVSASSCT
jgi:N-acetylated-alpha-linked acidic dipeptidase